jgi:hypothetical protein
MSPSRAPALYDPASGLRMGLFHRYIADNRNPGSLAWRMRKRRFALLEAQMTSHARPMRVLDVGGTVGFWDSMGARERGLEVTLLNMRPNTEPLPAGFAAVVGDARDLSQYADRSFDLVFSNSVIEHVGSFRDQLAMASEVRRVAGSYFVQTPNRYFPIEPHFLLPLFQFYPRPLQVALTQRFALGWYPRMPDREQASRHVASHRLLTRSEVAELFPDATIHEERIAGMAKSFVAARGA